MKALVLMTSLVLASASAYAYDASIDPHEYHGSIGGTVIMGAEDHDRDRVVVEVEREPVGEQLGDSSPFPDIYTEGNFAI